ncbi:MAG TPA: UDP-N-acetylmuramoyl-L-alanyl-D-glutamate--2,6-diaminopimelate ligase, partial [Clostridiales bacterium]|nr:UDP-N-acetylmuramoyl-L-alanyl-D-glutamate--2,6-diaminopimelate ligase [Clostridiales bacterium]
MNVSALLSELHIIEQKGIEDGEIIGICSDSRKPVKGHLFVAIRGERFDAHTLCKEMIEQGAVAVVVEQKPQEEIPYVLVADTREANTRLLAAYYGHPEKSFRYTIGLTGTNGKTSTSYMLRNIFRKAGYKVGLIGTMQYLIDDAEIQLDAADAVLTTPDSELLYRMFSHMRDAGVDVLIMEVSSHALSLRKVNVPFNLGIFTNLTQDHLDFHHTMEGYRQEKTKLFSMCQIGLFNSDDDSSAIMMAQSPAKNHTYGVKTEAEYAASDVTFHGSMGIAYTLKSPEGKTEIVLPIPGAFSVYNSLAAASGALVLGLDKDVVAEALGEMESVRGRIDRVEIDEPYAVFIDFAHTPDALENILQTLRGFTQNRLITLFGCGGDRDKTKRPKMAESAANLSDFVIITSDNARTEEKEAIIADILVGLKGKNTPHAVIVDRTQAIQYALHMAQPGDVILLAGKGH